MQSPGNNRSIFGRGGTWHAPGPLLGHEHKDRFSEQSCVGPLSPARGVEMPGSLGNPAGFVMWSKVLGAALGAHCPLARIQSGDVWGLQPPPSFRRSRHRNQSWQGRRRSLKSILLGELVFLWMCPELGLLWFCGQPEVRLSTWVGKGGLSVRPGKERMRGDLGWWQLLLGVWGTAGQVTQLLLALLLAGLRHQSLRTEQVFIMQILILKLYSCASWQAFL